MFDILYLVIFAGLIAILYGYIVGKQILSASPGNKKMQEIAAAIQEGARAYLNRQYKTIAIVGIVILVIITYALGIWVGLGYFIGAFLSGAAGYVGMLISVQANVRTAEASRKGLAAGLNIGFKSGAITGMLVAGLALLSIAIYYLILLKLNIDNREVINALVGLGFGASLISIFARLGGGIFTKGADVGADLVGKIEAGIPASTLPTKSAPTSAPLVKIPPPNLAKIDINEAPKPKPTNALIISLASIFSLSKNK